MVLLTQSQPYVVLINSFTVKATFEHNQAGFQNAFINKLSDIS